MLVVICSSCTLVMRPRGNATTMSTSLRPNTLLMAEPPVSPDVPKRTSGLNLHYRSRDGQIWDGRYFIPTSTVARLRSLRRKYCRNWAVQDMARSLNARVSPWNSSRMDRESFSWTSRTASGMEKLDSACEMRPTDRSFWSTESEFKSKLKTYLPVPQFKTWLTSLTAILHMERVRYGIIGNPNKFYRIWQPFLDYLSQSNADCNDVHICCWELVRKYALPLIQ